VTFGFILFLFLSTFTKSIWYRSFFFFQTQRCGETGEFLRKESTPFRGPVLVCWYVLKKVLFADCTYLQIVRTIGKLYVLAVNTFPCSGITTIRVPPFSAGRRHHFDPICAYDKSRVKYQRNGNPQSSLFLFEHLAPKSSLGLVFSQTLVSSQSDVRCEKRTAGKTTPSPTRQLARRRRVPF